MAQKQSQVADMSAGKGVSTAESNEQQRRWSDDLWRRKEAEANYNRSRAHLNFEIVKGGKVQPIDQSLTIEERMHQRMDELGIKDRNLGLSEPKYRTCARIIFQGSRARMLQMAFGDQPIDVEHRNDDSHLELKEDFVNWAKDIYQFVADRYGEENIVGFYAHLDEKNPHLHVTVLPITPEGKLKYKAIFGGSSKFELRDRMLKFHDDLAKVNAKWGLERGSNVHETGARHRSTEEYRRVLARECDQLGWDIADRRKKLSELDEEIRKKEIKQKSLTTMIENLTKEISNLQIERQSIERDINLGKISIDEGERKLALIDELLDTKNLMIQDKQAKLNEAQQELQALQEKKSHMAECVDTFHKVLQHSTDELNKDTHTRIKAAAFDWIATWFINSYSDMLFKQQEAFEDTLLKDICEHGEEIFGCASRLFWGIVDDSTNIQQSGGGGGSSSDMPWDGRRDDEDYMDFMRRCVHEAHRRFKANKSSNNRGWHR